MLVSSTRATLFHFQLISTPVMASNIYALMNGEKTRPPVLVPRHPAYPVAPAQAGAQPAHIQIKQIVPIPST
jgi:hypothetical protein